ncbi:MAG TPA: hypothetical protein VN426_05460 [Syntrophomonadaceae bacterium]|nr:hypothetical protein [Syntrophomonadaceae bacterium]
MPRMSKYGGYKPDRPAVAMAKGKTGKSFANELFAQADNFLYEFGIIGRPHKQPDEPQQEKE